MLCGKLNVSCDVDDVNRCSKVVLTDNLVDETHFDDSQFCMFVSMETYTDQRALISCTLFTLILLYVRILSA